MTVFFAALDLTLSFLLLVSFLPSALLHQPAYAQASNTTTTTNNSNNDDGSPITLESKSDQGTLLVRIEWTQAKKDILSTAAGANNNSNNDVFTIHFIEPETGKELEEMTYDFIVASASGQEEVHRQSQTASKQSVAFSAEGPYTIKIANIDGLGEGARFDVRVTPEFAPSAAMAAAAAGIAFATVFGAKFRKGL